MAVVEHQVINIPMNQRIEKGGDDCCNCNPPLDEQGNVNTCCGDCDPCCFKAMMITFGVVGGLFILIGLITIVTIVGWVFLLVGIGLAAASCSLCCCCVQQHPTPATSVTLVTSTPQPQQAAVVEQSDVEVATLKH